VLDDDAPPRFGDLQNLMAVCGVPRLFFLNLSGVDMQTIRMNRKTDVRHRYCAFEDQPTFARLKSPTEIKK